VKAKETTLQSTIYTGGSIFTADRDNLDVEAILVEGERIRATGALDHVKALSSSSNRTVDLGGAFLAPGFNDNHTHPPKFGESLVQIDASPRTVPTLQRLLDAFRASACSNGVAEWIIGRGYDDTRLDVHRHPTRDELDQVSAEQPILLVRTCGHLGVANSAALAAAGISDTTPDPQGGQIDQDQHGRATGLLRETALKLVQRVEPRPTRADIARYLTSAGNVFLSQGITSVADASITRPEQLGAYQDLARSCELPFRVYTMMLIDDMLDTLSSLGIQTGFGDEWVRIGPAKVFQDGSGGGRTAAMFDAYRDQPDNYGITYYSQDELDERFGRAHDAGFQLAAHAIGDRAITMILDAYEHALGDDIVTDHRARIEHCGMCTPAILERLKRMGVFAAPQPTFIHYLGDSYLENFSDVQLEHAYPLRSFQEYGIPYSLSSDVPVTPCASMINLHAAVTRRTQDGATMADRQGISVEEALIAYTFGGAYGSREERLKGTLRPGALADIVVLSADPRTVDPDVIRKITVQQTILGGDVRYEA
jgi:predicted amidohydrolase YtcJ